MEELDTQLERHQAFSAWLARNEMSDAMKGEYQAELQQRVSVLQQQLETLCDGSFEWAFRVTEDARAAPKEPPTALLIGPTMAWQDAAIKEALSDFGASEDGVVWVSNQQGHLALRVTPHNLHDFLTYTSDKSYTPRHLTCCSSAADDSFATVLGPAFFGNELDTEIEMQASLELEAKEVRKHGTL